MELFGKGMARWEITYSSLDRLLDLGQPHIWRTHLAMWASCFMTLIIQACSSMSFGVGRVAASTVRLRQRRHLDKKTLRQAYSRQPDEVFHLVTPLHTGFVLESRRLLRRMLIGCLSWMSFTQTSPVVIYIISSIGGRSLGNGNLFCTSSRRDMPVDQTSERIVYSCPQILSGWDICQSGVKGMITALTAM